MANVVEQEKPWEGVSLLRAMGGPNMNKESKLGKKDGEQSSEELEGW